MLRPGFTRLLAERLLRGDNINLQGDHGLGRRQTVEDLCSLLPENVSICRLDIRRDRTNPDTWLSQSIEQKGEKLLILHNFDELDLEKSSNRKFIEQLSEIADEDGISLLLVTVSLPAGFGAQWGLSIDTLPLPPLP